MTTSPTNLTSEEWQIIERLSQIHDSIEECPGLDYHDFHSGIVNLQNQVLALPVRRALKSEKE